MNTDNGPHEHDRDDTESNKSDEDNATQAEPTLAPPIHSDGPQNGVKGVRADARRQAALEQELKRLQVAQTNQRLESKSLQAQTIEEEDRDRDQAAQVSIEAEDLDEDDEAFKRRWREKRMEELRQGQQVSGNDEEEIVLEKHRLREVDADGFLKEVEKSRYTAVLLYESDLSRCHPFLQAFLDLSSSSSSKTTTFLKARATSLSFSLLHSEPDEEPRSDPDVLPSVLLYKEGELQESFIRVDLEVGDTRGGDLVAKLQGLFRRKGLPIL